MTNLRRRQLVFVIGTRAQLIKIAPVIVACERAALQVIMLMTGQHQETMQDLIEEFGVRALQVPAVPAIERATIPSLLRWGPAAYLGVMRELRAISADGADIDVLVHGDTLSTLIGALAGRRCGARVVHLESGLSSGRVFDPFPEEIVRRMVFRLTDLAMCPNPAAAAYMRLHYRARVVDTGGNTIIDAVALSGTVADRCDSAEPYLVVSLHRFQNLYDRKRLCALVSLIERLSARFPVHFILHPATRKRLQAEDLEGVLRSAKGVTLSPRLGYREFLRLAARATCVLTDGGSNQEELAALGVPTIVMRARTERPDGLGANALMEADVPGGVLSFLFGGRHESLRRHPEIRQGPGPSALIVGALLADDVAVTASVGAS